MREPLEMITVSRMQDMVEISKKNTYFVIKSFFFIKKVRKKITFRKHCSEQSKNC